jgi:hypothetical protein
MKSSTQVFVSLLAAFAMIGQSTTYVYAAYQVTIDNKSIDIGTKTRTNFLNCSESNPCINDQIVIDSYNEKFSNDGTLEGANIVLHNTSFAPAAIEVYSSDGTLKNVDFVDGTTAGFKDLGEFTKTVALGLIEPFRCGSKGLLACWKDFKYGRYDVARNDLTLKLQSGDVIRISRGSDAAHAYTLASSLIDIVELIKSIPGVNTSKVKFSVLFQEYSKELRRKIVRKFIIDKIKEKYTWKMLIQELGYESFKRTASNSQDIFDNSLEIIKNIPQDFWDDLKDGTIQSAAAGDFLDTLIPMVSAKASIYVNSALFASQSVGIKARYMASETAYENPSYIIVAGLKDSSTSSNQPITTKVSPERSTPKGYLTNSDVKILRQQLRQQVEKLQSDESVSHYVRRSSSERQARNIFVNNWNKIDSSISPFLGLWTGDYFIYIYPSKKRQRVCVISLDEGHYSFSNGNVHNSVLYIGNGQILFKEDLYLGMGGIQNGKPQLHSLIPYGSPTLPKSIVEIINSSEEAEKSSIRQGFKDNGCISPTLESTTATPSQCSTVLEQSKSVLTNITRFEISKLSKYDGISPQGKTQHLTIISSGIQGSTSLAMSTKIIASCPKIGSVRFVVNGTDDQSVYGLLNGKVQIFKCRNIEKPYKWGQYPCS